MSRFKYIFVPFILLLYSVGVYAQKSLPDFQFQDLEGNSFSKQDLESDLATIAIFFDPYCDHCAQQAKWMVEAKDTLKDVQMIWVTTEELEGVKNFYEEYFGEENMPNLHILRDTEYMFDAYFGYSEVPSIYVYNKSGQRVKAFNKEVPPSILLKFL